MMQKQQVVTPVQVLAVGKGWLVADKPAGMSVHNAPGQDLCSHVADVILRDARLAEIVAFEPDFGVNPVHRLDKETSGAILLAVTPREFRFFSRQFESRQVKKLYTAILHGYLEYPEGEGGWGIWHWPLSKAAAGRDNPQGPNPRQTAETRYRVLDHSAHYTLVEVEPLSGRKHQIRRHAKLSGHPVVGDSRYGSARAINYLKQHAGFDRLALHARSLALQLPNAKRQKLIETQALPAAMARLFESDRSAD